MNEQKTFGAYLKNKRQLIGMSQLDVAKAADVSNVLIHRLENDFVKNPSHVVLLKLESIFKMTNGELTLKYQSFLKAENKKTYPKFKVGSV